MLQSITDQKRKDRTALFLHNRERFLASGRQTFLPQRCGMHRNSPTPTIMPGRRNVWIRGCISTRIHAWEHTGGPPCPRVIQDPSEVFYVPTAVPQHVVSGVSLKPHLTLSLRRQKLISSLQLSRHYISVVGRFVSLMPRISLSSGEKSGVRSLLENATWTVSATFSVSCEREHSNCVALNVPQKLLQQNSFDNLTGNCLRF